MTVDELLARCRDRRFNAEANIEERKTCVAVVDMLGEAETCGMDDMVSVHTLKNGCKVVCIGEFSQNISTGMGPSEARAFAVQVLRAADEAEVKR
jgi:hypothetical protein